MKNENHNKLYSVLLTVLSIVGTVATILSAPQEIKVIGVIILIIIFLFGIWWVFNSFFGTTKRVLSGAREVGLINLRKDRLHGVNFVKENISIAKEIRLFGVSGNQSVPDYGKEFRHSLAMNRANLKVIFAMQGGLIYDEDIEDKKGVSINESIIKDVTNACSLLNEYLLEAELDAKRENRLVGNIEIGFFDIHNRVPMLICDDRYAAFHLSLPPKRSIESVFLKLKEKGIYHPKKKN